MDAAGRLVALRRTATADRFIGIEFDLNFILGYDDAPHVEIFQSFQTHRSNFLLGKTAEELGHFPEKRMIRGAADQPAVTTHPEAEMLHPAPARDMGQSMGRGMERGMGRREPVVTLRPQTSYEPI